MKGTGLYDGDVRTNSKEVLKKRKRRLAFQFIQKGSIVSKAEQIRTHGEKYDPLLDKEALKGARPQMQARALQRVTFKVKHHDKIPEVEWWDKPLLKNKIAYHTEKFTKNRKGNPAEEEKREIQWHESNIKKIESMDFDNGYFEDSKITPQIFHPKSISNPNQTSSTVEIPTFYNKDERKKMKRLHRQAKEQEKRDKIALGIIQAPPPKITLKNFMNVMTQGKNAFIDPTQAEQFARAQTEARLKAHQ